MARKMKEVKAADVRGYMWNREGTEKALYWVRGATMVLSTRYAGYQI